MNASHINPALRHGQLFIISAPSGTGKTTLVRALVEKLDKIMISISHTTRPQRPGETDGVDYHFIDDADFDTMVTANKFLEHARVFGHQYGTSLTTLDQQRASGTDVILEIDWQGAQQVRKRVSDAISVFIVPPSYESLVERLNNRGRDDTETIKRRLREAVSELSHYHEYDYVIVNDTVEQALAELHTIVEAARLRLSSRRPALDDFIGRLIAQAREIQ
jgi:guanylate kinase